MGASQRLVRSHSERATCFLPQNIDVDDLVCPLFMSDEELQDPKNADHLAWITDCQYGNMSHLEIAEEMKDKANLIFKGGFQKEGGAQQAANPKLAVTIYDDGICNADLVRRSLSQQRLFLLLLAGHLHFNAKFPPPHHPLA